MEQTFAIRIDIGGTKTLIGIVDSNGIINRRNLSISAESIAEAAYEGAGGLSIYSVAGKYLEKALSSIVNILNPVAIIIGGGSCSFDSLESIVRDILKISVINEAIKMFLFSQRDMAMMQD